MHVIVIVLIKVAAFSLMECAGSSCMNKIRNLLNLNYLKTILDR